MISNFMASRGEKGVLLPEKLRLHLKNIASYLALWLHPAVSQEPLESKRCRMEVFYSGHVQGVGFRYSAKTVAMGFEITGTVRNLSDGRVQLIAEGRRAELESFRTAIREAGLGSLIRDEKVAWTEAQNEFKGFEIVR